MRHLFAVLLFVSLATGFAGPAEDAEAFLARPLDPATLTPESAKRWLDEGAQLAAGAADKQAEIDAKLIPARRVVDDAIPKPAPPEAKAKPLLILDNGTKVTVFKAESSAANGAVLEAVGADGRKAAWQKQFLRAELAWFTPEELASGAVDLAPLESAYGSALRTFTNAHDIAVVRDELNRVRGLLTRRQAEAARKSSAAALAAAPVLKQIYRPDANHTRADLARTLLAAEQARREADDALRARLDEVIAPFRTHYENLLAGKILDEGVWRTPAEVEARARQARYRLFEREFSLTLPAQVVTESQVTRALSLVLGVAAVIALVALVCLFGKRSFMMRFFGLVLLGGVGGSVFYYVQQLQSGPTALPPPGATADPSKLVRVAYLAGLTDPAQEPGAESSFALGSADVTEFLRTHVKWQGDTNSVHPTRRALDVAWVKNGVWISELVRWKGRDYVVTHRLRFFGKPEKLGLHLESTSVGRATLPEAFGRPLWNSLSAGLARAITQPPVLQWFQASAITPGQAVLSATYSATPPPAPEPAPAPAEPAPAVAAAPETPPPAPATAAPTETTTEAVVTVTEGQATATTSTTTATAPADAPAPAMADPSAPRVYVGGAYQPALTDMSTRHADWAETRAGAGFHLHPVGWHPSFAKWNIAGGLLKAFKHQRFTAEEDLGSLAHGGHSMTWPATLVREGQKYGHKWQCVAVTVNVGTDALTADPEKCAKELLEFTADARKANVPAFVLFSPVTPAGVKSFDALNQKKDGEPVWVWVAKRAQLSGVAIDYPAGHFLGLNEKYRVLAKEIATTTKGAGLQLIWMFNGGTAADDTEAAAKEIKNRGIQPDLWIVSHFHDREYPGTPESNPDTVTSQARALLQLEPAPPAGSAPPGAPRQSSAAPAAATTDEAPAATAAVPTAPTPAAEPEPEAPTGTNGPIVFVGGVAGAEAIAEGTNSTAFRQAGGALYLHNNGWGKLSAEQREETLRLFRRAPVGIELGFGVDDRARAWASRLKSGYLAAGIKPHFIAANAFAENNKPTAEQWETYTKGLRDAGLPASTLVLPTFEYANFGPNVKTLLQNLVSESEWFQSIIREAGGIVLDTPSIYFFRREENYRTWVRDAVQWTRKQGLRTVIIFSPNIAGENYAEETKRYLEWLKKNKALPDWYVVENYNPGPPEDYPNTVGHEAMEDTQLGVALMMLKWTGSRRVPGSAP